MSVERKTPHHAWLAVCVGSALGTSAAQALDWNQTPTVAVYSGNDSNLHLSTTDEGDVTSSGLDLSTNVVGAGERMQLTLRPRINATNYSDERERDRRDGYFDTSLAVGNERQRWTLSGGYVRDGTLLNAFEESGFTTVDVDRDRSNLAVGWSRTTSERGTTSLSLSSQSVRHEEVVGDPFLDYDQAGARFAYTHALRERVNVEFGVRASQLDTEAALGATNSVGVGVTFSGSWSESLEYRIGGGRYRSRYPDVIATENSDTAFDASLAKRWERWRVTTSLSSGIEASSYGVFYRREAASFDVNHRFTEALDAGLRFTAAHIESDQPLFYYEDRRYAYAQLSLNWRFAERLWLSTSLGARAQEYLGQERARGAYGQIGLTYRGRGS